MALKNFFKALKNLFKSPAKSRSKPKSKISTKSVKSKRRASVSKSKSKKIEKTKVSSVKKTAKSIKSEKPNGVLVGEVTHYFSKIQVVVVKVKGDHIKVGDMIQVKGNSSDFKQKILSLQIESVDVKVAKKGKLVGLKVIKEAKPGDLVYRV